MVVGRQADRFTIRRAIQEHKVGCSAVLGDGATLYRYRMIYRAISTHERVYRTIFGTLHVGILRHTGARSTRSPPPHPNLTELYPLTTPAHSSMVLLLPSPFLPLPPSVFSRSPSSQPTWPTHFRLPLLLHAPPGGPLPPPPYPDLPTHQVLPLLDARGAALALWLVGACDAAVPKRLPVGGVRAGSQRGCQGRGYAGEEVG